jgi:hypothetical protein
VPWVGDVVNPGSRLERCPWEWLRPQPIPVINPGVAPRSVLQDKMQDKPKAASWNNTGLRSGVAVINCLESGGAHR